MNMDNMMDAREIKRRGNRDKNAQALIFAFMVIVFLTLLSAPLLNRIISERAMLERQRLEQEAFYLAEGGMDDAINRFINAIANFQVQPNITRYPATGIILTVYSPSFAFPHGAEVESVITEGESHMRQITDSDGTIVGVKTYIVTSSCQHPRNGTIAVTLNQAIFLRVIYTFQHAVFYVDDLEILPGPNMNFTGRIHTNKDMYLDSHNTLTLNSEYVYSAGNIYNRRKDSLTYLSGDVRIKREGTGAYFNMAGLDSSDPDWLTLSQNRWHGTVKSSVHGVTKLSTPAVGSIKPGGYYNNNAGVVVENGSIKHEGRVLEAGIDIPAGTISTNNDFYNNREGKIVNMLNIDLKKLAGYVPGDSDGNPSFPNYLPSNGLIYAAGSASGTLQQQGVRLVNGGQIYRPGGLTVVTDSPLYIQGDYNNINKQPTAVICDSVNILSNSWDDANSLGVLNARNANNTTINTAFISGVDNTTLGQYNGGLENYPRLHENWSGRTLLIRGSFVQLWNSQIAQGNWIYGNPQYTAPNRNWDYDNDFNNVNNMPPFTPWAVEARRSAWWRN